MKWMPALVVFCDGYFKGSIPLDPGFHWGGMALTVFKFFDVLFHLRRKWNDNKINLWPFWSFWKDNMAEYLQKQLDTLEHWRRKTDVSALSSLSTDCFFSKNASKGRRWHGSPSRSHHSLTWYFLWTRWNVSH